jgi:membrane fusion protein (multidrug efflux system)
MRRLCLFSLLIACDPGTAPPKDAGVDAAAAAPVEVVVLERGEVRDGVDGTATVQARHTASLRARVSGTVAPFTLEEGSPVTQNQVLVRLEQSGIAGALSKAQASARKTQSDLRTLERLRKDGLIPAQELDEAQFAANQARLEVKRLQDERARAQVITPLDGVITARLVQPGEAVSPGTELFRVANLDQLDVELRVPERHLPRLKTGLPVEITADGLDAPLTGTVHRIAPTVDARSGTAKITVALTETQALRPGMYIRARIIVDTHPDAVLLPKRALIYEDERAIAYRVTDGHAKRVTVPLGYADRDQIEARSGLSAGDQIIVFGHRGLEDGAAVRILAAPPATPASEAP